MPYPGKYKDKKRKRRRVRVMKEFRIDELSGVRVPAQRGAGVVIMKRDGSAPARPGEVEKGCLVDMVTGEADGHVHGINIWNHDGDISLYVMGARSGEDEYEHDHCVLRRPDGTYAVVENAGHTHTLDTVALAAAMMGTVAKTVDARVWTSSGTEFAPGVSSNTVIVGAERHNEGSGAMNDKEIAALKAENERLEAIVKMSAEHRSYYEALDADGQAQFIKRSETDRTAVIEIARRAQEDADPVVYTTRDGVDIRKSDGAGALAMAKSADALRGELADVRDENSKLVGAAVVADLQKRAAVELSNLPGSIEHRAALLKAVDGIPDEDARATAMAALKSQNDGLAPIFKMAGIGAASDPVGTAQDTAQRRLDELTKSHQEAHPDVSFAVAQDAVLQTREGSELYRQIEGRSARAVM